jgi:hypothetical protein
MLTWRVEFLGTDKYEVDEGKWVVDVQATNPIEAIKAANAAWDVEVGSAGPGEHYRVYEITFSPVRTFEVTDGGDIHETTERA